MKEFTNQLPFLNKLEFWAATAICVLAVLALSNSEAAANETYRTVNAPFHYYTNYFLPLLVQYTATYLTFFWLNFKVVNKLVRKDAVVQNAILLMVAFLALGLVFSAAEIYAKQYLFYQFPTRRQAYEMVFQEGFLHALVFFLLLAFYSLCKYTSLYYLSDPKQTALKNRIFFRDGFVGFILWLTGLFLLILSDADPVLIVLWGIAILYAILLYCFSFYSLIPRSLHRKHVFRSYLIKTLLVQVVFLVPVIIIAALTILIFKDNADDDVFRIVVLNQIFQSLVTVPLCWVLFQRHLKRNAALYELKTELEQSNAHLDFLRSQINPHFLFNTLNTLYGTALQENAERTAQGVQMLGDMMRFMLHENHRPRIALSREIEYMRNYIALQSLRTASSPDIMIDTRIEEVPDSGVIAPMLLIPFVENAFKHGISLQRKSWIKVALHTVENRLFFEVRNSTHPRQENDPEQDKSGIGLENVKQRLMLIYPEKHELVIKETEDEHFIHLIIQL